MRPFWKFAKPTGPGFGINKNFYLSVLAGKPVLPVIAEIAAPKPANGALDGFAVPLVNSTDKALLAQPMTRGKYAIATKDQKTVIELMVMSADEAGFSPEYIAKSGLATRVSPEVLARIRSTWHLMQLSFKSHDPEVYPALDFFFSIAKRLGELTEGVIADPLSERYLMPSELFALPRVNPGVDAREIVAIHQKPDQGKVHLYTKGLLKISRPELEMYEVPEVNAPAGAAFLLSVSQGVLEGFPVESGSRVEMFEAREGGLDRAKWDGIPVMELLPPTGVPIQNALNQWFDSVNR